MRGAIEIGLSLPSRGPLARRAIEAAVETLARANEAYLRAHPNTPALAKSGVEYQRERRPRGTPENWQGIEDIIREGHGDCEDLSAWRIAELRNRGVRAKPHVIRANPNRDGRWHIMVAVYRRGRRTVEDPSKELGM